MPHILISGCPRREAGAIIARLSPDCVVSHREDPVLVSRTAAEEPAGAPDAVLFIMNRPAGSPFSEQEESFFRQAERDGIPVILVTREKTESSRNHSRWISESIPIYSDSRKLNGAIKRAILTHAAREPAAESPVREEAGGLLLGTSRAAVEVKSLIMKFAESDLPVLILGETGTGKELAALSIHRLSGRGQRSFVPRNCAAIPLSLIETELFGSERGAYTDAISRPGCFQLADQGTLFLDEIGDLSLSGQAKLLRAIEHQEILPVGGVHPVKTDVRIISATNRNLRKEMSSRRFRSDLYYRVSTLILPIPPLRERKEDIPILVQSCIEEEGKNRFLEREALECLYEYDWPGNIRELRSVVKRALVISRSERIERRDIVFDRDE